MKNRAYILSESDRTRINRQIERLEGAPPPAMLPNSSQRTYLSPDAYWGLPPCETGLPAAERDPLNGDLTPGMAMCCLYKYDSQYGKLMPVRQPTGLPVKVLVKNFYLSVINTQVQIWKQKDGTWANEQPQTSQAVVTANPAQIVRSPSCEGQCVWVATDDLAWSGPVGGCRNTTSTTTTSSPTVTSTTTTFPPTTTTLPPCPSRNCRLRCVAATTTTPAPGQPPAPETGYKYQVVGTTCAAPCSCYGVNEPCYVPNGEIESRCVYINPTTTSSPTTTTTGGPLFGSPACERIQSVLGATPDGYFRAATLVGGLGGWQICQDCPPGFVPFRPLGGDEPQTPGTHVDAVYHQTKCIPSPCHRLTFDDVDDQQAAATGAVYGAYTYGELLAVFDGVENFNDYVQVRNGKYLANWFLCSECYTDAVQGPRRPTRPPPIWLSLDVNQNVDPYLKLNNNNIYQYRTACSPGYPCDNCEFSSAFAEASETLQIPQSTTPAPTTTPRPCGCPYPGTCPSVPGECTKTVCEPGGAWRVPDALCPVSTPFPGHWCRDRHCGLCHCDAGGVAPTTTVTSTTPLPCGGQCTWSIINTWHWGGPANAPVLEKIPRVIQTETCTRGSTFFDMCDCGLGPTGVDLNPITMPCGATYSVPCVRSIYLTTTPTPCIGCIGSCLWQPCATYSRNENTGQLEYVLRWCFGYTGGYWLGGAWWNGGGCLAVGADNSPCNSIATPGPPNAGTSLYYSGCSIVSPDWWDYFFVDSTSWYSNNNGCSCPIPPGTPGLCDLTETFCASTVYQACSCCNASPTSNPCGQQCGFRGNGYGGWVKIYDPCPTSCPCPVAPSFSSEDECQRAVYSCGSINVTTVSPPTTPTTQTTTTQGPGACCYPGGACSFVLRRFCLTSQGGVWQGPGTSCSGSTCDSFTTTSTTTEGPGRCCYPNNLNCAWTSRDYCNRVNGTFTPGINCSTPCSTTTSTTLSPLGSCCNIGTGRCISAVRSNYHLCQAGTWVEGPCSAINYCLGRCCVQCSTGEKYCLDGITQVDCVGYGSNYNHYCPGGTASQTWVSGGICGSDSFCASTTGVPSTAPPT